MMVIGLTTSIMEEVRSKSDEIGTMEYPNGEKYEGDWKDGKRNGKGILCLNLLGTYFLNNGDKYDADWVDDVPSDKSKMIE